MANSLKTLGFGESGTAMLVEPPDRVLAEAGALTPRPSVASSIMTAEPSAILAWWPEPDTLTATALARLRWMLGAGAGKAWIVLDPGAGLQPGDDMAVLLAQAGMVAADSLALDSGETALLARLAPEATAS